MDSSTSEPAAPAGKMVSVYGTRWCAATQMIRRYLDRHQIPYDFYDIDADRQANQQVKWWAGGNASHPTLQIGGEVFVEPSTGEVERALQNLGLM